MTFNYSFHDSNSRIPRNHPVLISVVVSGRFIERGPLFLVGLRGRTVVIQLSNDRFACNQVGFFGSPPFLQELERYRNHWFGSVSSQHQLQT